MFGISQISYSLIKEGISFLAAKLLSGRAVTLITACMAGYLFKDRIVALYHQIFPIHRDPPKDDLKGRVTPPPPSPKAPPIPSPVPSPVPSPAPSPPPLQAPDPERVVFTLTDFKQPDNYDKELEKLQEWSRTRKPAWDNICKVFSEDIEKGKLDPKSFIDSINVKTKLNSSPYTIFSLLLSDAEMFFENALKTWIEKDKFAWYNALIEFSLKIDEIKETGAPYLLKLRRVQSSTVQELKKSHLKAIAHIPDNVIISGLMELHQTTLIEKQIAELITSWQANGTFCEKERDGIRFFLPYPSGAEFVEKCKQEGIEANVTGFRERRGKFILNTLEGLNFNQALRKVKQEALYQVVHLPPHKDAVQKGNYQAIHHLVMKDQETLKQIDKHFRNAFNIDGEEWGLKLQRHNLFDFRIVIPEDKKDLVKIKYVVFAMFKELKINSHFFAQGVYLFDDKLIKNFDAFATFPRIDPQDRSNTIERMEKRFRIKDEFEEKMEAIAEQFGTELTLEYGSKPLSDFIPHDTPAEDYPKKFQIAYDAAQDVIREGGSIALPFAMQIQTSDNRFMLFLEVLYALGNIKAWNKKEKIFITDTRAPGANHLSNIDATQMAALTPLLDKILYAKEEDYKVPAGATVSMVFKAHAAEYGKKVKKRLEEAFQTHADLRALDRVQTFKEVDTIKFNFLAALVRKNYALSPQIWVSQNDKEQEANRKKLGTFDLATRETIEGNLVRKKAIVKERATLILDKFQATLFYRRAKDPLFQESFRNLKTAIFNSIERGEDGNNYYSLTNAISALDFIEVFLANEEKLSKEILGVIEVNFIDNKDAWIGCQSGLETKLYFLSTLSEGGKGILGYTKELERNLQQLYFNIKRGIAPHAIYYLEPDGAHGQKAIEIMAAKELGFPGGNVSDTDKNDINRQNVKNELVAFIKCALTPFESLVLPEIMRYLKEIQEKKSNKQDPSPLLLMLGIPAVKETNPFYDPFNDAWDFEKIEQELPILVIQSLIKLGLLVDKQGGNNPVTERSFRDFMNLYRQTLPAEFQKRTQRQDPVPQPAVRDLPFKDTPQGIPEPNFPKFGKEQRVTLEAQYFSCDPEGKILPFPIFGERADEKIVLPTGFQ